MHDHVVECGAQAQGEGVARDEQVVGIGGDGLQGLALCQGRLVVGAAVIGQGSDEQVGDGLVGTLEVREQLTVGLDGTLGGILLIGLGCCALLVGGHEQGVTIVGAVSLLDEL